MVFEVEFVTFRGVYRNIKTEKLNVPTEDGRRGILSNHMPIVLPLSDIPMGVIRPIMPNKINVVMVIIFCLDLNTSPKGMWKDSFLLTMRAPASTKGSIILLPILENNETDRGDRPKHNRRYPVNDGNCLNSFIV